MKKKLISLVILVILICVNCMFVQAATTTSKLKPSKSRVENGEAFTVTLAVECDEGIRAAEIEFSYDESKLELQGTSSEDVNFQTMVAPKDNQVNILVTTLDKITKSDEFCTFRFKAKYGENVKGTANISVTRIDVANADGNVVGLPVASTSVEIGEEQGPANNTTYETNEIPTNGVSNITPTPTPTPTPAPAPTTNPTNKTPTNGLAGGTNTGNNTITPASGTDQTVAASILPRTGTGRAIVLIVIVALVGLGVFSYKEIQKYKGI